ncbi:hypothetical protein AAFF_G00439630 [Aldrovandia affinis]|uniref:Uncharacterized protein n=1 Tax=Aldrovandia affinis TaxID=143900 RepID=A0AAD7S7J5_9TELE|nr:hypothetical protein AAFF_G00439630 [Aldrovandia affinis]
MGLIRTLEQCLNRMQTVRLIHTLEQCLNRMQTVGLIHALEQCLNRMLTMGLIPKLEHPVINAMSPRFPVSAVSSCDPPAVDRVFSTAYPLRHWAALVDGDR